jgi:hypothetical protein
MRAPDQREELLEGRVARRHGRDALLRQDVERILGDAEAIELAGANGAHRRCGLREVVARQRKMTPRETAPRACPERPTRWSSVAIARGAPMWQTRSDRADVDAELERRRRHHRPGPRPP